MFNSSSSFCWIFSCEYVCIKCWPTNVLFYCCFRSFIIEFASQMFHHLRAENNVNYTCGTLIPSSSFSSSSHVFLLPHQFHRIRNENSLNDWLCSVLYVSCFCIIFVVIISPCVSRAQRNAVHCITTGDVFGYSFDSFSRWNCIFYFTCIRTLYSCTFYSYLSCYYYYYRSPVSRVSPSLHHLNECCFSKINNKNQSSTSLFVRRHRHIFILSIWFDFETIEHTHCPIYPRHISHLQSIRTGSFILFVLNS